MTSDTSTSEIKGVDSMIENGIETVLKDETDTEASSSSAAAAAEQPQQQPSKSKLKAKANAKGKGLIPLSIAMFVLGALIGGSVTYGVHALKARNGSAGTTTTITSESIAVAPPTNPGTITLNAGGGMIISGSVKLTADIEVEGQLPSGAAITLLPGAVLDCNGHSITGDLTGENAGIFVKGVGTKVKITNCPAVTKLEVGAYLEGEGQDVVIENSSFDHNNFYGINALNTKAGGRLVMNDVSASNTKSGSGMILGSWDTMKLNKIVAHGNTEAGAALKGQDVTIENSSFDHNGGDYGIFGSGFDENGGGSLVVKDVSASNTKYGSGMVFVDWDTVILNKVVATENGVQGVYAYFNSISSSRTLILKGKNSFDNNDGYGLFIAGDTSSSRATVLVDGKVTANANGNDVGTGIFAKDADFEIKKGSVEACGNSNGLNDIGSQTSTFLGKKYICDLTSGTEVPVCKPCRDGKARKLGVSN
jgi:hypothetical protein